MSTVAYSYDRVNAWVHILQMHRGSITEMRLQFKITLQRIALNFSAQFSRTRKKILNTLCECTEKLYKLIYYAQKITKT